MWRSLQIQNQNTKTQKGVIPFTKVAKRLVANMQSGETSITHSNDDRAFRYRQI